MNQIILLFPIDFVFRLYHDGSWFSPGFSSHNVTKHYLLWRLNNEQNKTKPQFKNWVGLGGEKPQLSAGEEEKLLVSEHPSHAQPWAANFTCYEVSSPTETVIHPLLSQLRTLKPREVN